MLGIHAILFWGRLQEPVQLLTKPPYWAHIVMRPSKRHKEFEPLIQWGTNCWMAIISFLQLALSNANATVRIKPSITFTRAQQNDQRSPQSYQYSAAIARMLQAPDALKTRRRLQHVEYNATASGTMLNWKRFKDASVDRSTDIAIIDAFSNDWSCN